MVEPCELLPQVRTPRSIACARLTPRRFTRPLGRVAPDSSVEETIMQWFRGASLVAAALTMGLMAGLFYAYACSVMLGLRRADDRTFVDGMQRINVAILNGWFFASFLGALLLTALAGVLHLGAGWR